MCVDNNPALLWLCEQTQQAIKSVKQLVGLTACSYQVELANGERYVLRQQSPRASQLGINYWQEAQHLQYISALLFAPLPRYADQHSSLLTWIEGQHPRDFSNDLLKTLAMQLASLHQVELQAVDFRQNFAILDLAERCQFLWQQLPKQTQQQCRSQPPFERIEPLKIALCHHDLHLGNLLTQGSRLFLIDWEYSAISDIALEIGLFFQGNTLTTPQKRLFLNHYCSQMNLDQAELATKIAEYQPEMDKLTELWFAVAQQNNY